MSKKKQFKIKICGDPWSVILFTGKQYKAKINDTTSAITYVDHTKNGRLIIFRDDDFTKSTVIHEVTHAFFSYQYLGSTRIKLDDAEEIFCDFIANRIEDIRKVSNVIYRRLR